MRGMLAQLSPHEEITLRRIALGFGIRDQLSPRYVERLVQLELVEDVDGLLRLTDGGLERYGKLERPTKWADVGASQEISRLLMDNRAKLHRG